MSNASQGAPAKRPEPQRDLAEDVAVEVRRLEDDKETQDGIVRELREYDTQTRVVVTTIDGDIANVAEEQVDVLTGVDAKRVAQQAEDNNV
ncbi:hypothetical protein [Haloarcula sp. JP-L23]|uniref:hypothetical protein n=1 Tax=Haloarcula sp. JP-L23 TaxID=2716717 RepID=UPI00140EAE95|nr:hypothetical protein G9465_24985 [Haloarcula sp. JP-L23]